MQEKTIIWLLIAISLVLILCCALLFNYGSKCNNNPFTFGASIVKDKANVEIECSCYAVKSGKTYEPMHFNSTNVWFGDKKIEFLDVNP